jgi:transcriptional regulator with GAF, ATPase, and Fis domain
LNINIDIDENEFFRQFTILLCGSLDIEKALERCFHYVRKKIPVNGMYLIIYEPGRDMTTTLASASLEESDKLDPVYHWPSEARKQMEPEWEVFEGAQIVNRPELEYGTRYMAKMIGKNEISLISLRLKIDEKLLGALVVYTDGFDQYTQDHAELIQLLHDPIAIAMSNALIYQEVSKLKDMLTDDNRYLRQELLNISGAEIIGAGFGLKAVMEMVRQVAPLNSPVLLLGDTGVGKEVIANAIHFSSARSEGPFIKVNCGAIPENLIDSELFGHEKGSFTGAISQKRGRFERANKGTIFLDEIGELPLQAQVRLLRVLQNKEIERVGGTTSIPVDVRIISATNKNLAEMVSEGKFRDDLWFRLNVFPIIIPPLRQRRDDIPALVHHFIERKSREMKIDNTVELAPGAIDRLKTYHWPGNVRELGNVVERALILNHRENKSFSLTFDNLVEPDLSNHNAIPYAYETGDDFPTLDKLNSMHISRALSISNGKINGPNGAAEILNIHPHTLRKRMDKLGIPYGRKRKTGTGN